MTLALGRDLPGAMEVPYCTLQPALLSLPAHCRQLDQTARPAGAMRNASYNPDLQALAVRWAALYPLHPHGPAGSLLSSSLLYLPKT